jgi:hypothetical protein
MEGCSEPNGSPRAGKKALFSLYVLRTVGQYTLVSMALNTLGVQRDAEVPGFEE